MQILLRWMAVLTLLIGLYGEASARDVFVDNTGGDDRFLGTHQQPLSDGSGPVKTLARALQIAISGDHIVLTNSGVPYRESVTLFGSRHSGIGGRPFVIEGNGAILEGADEINVERWQHAHDSVFYFRPHHLVYQQLFLNDKPVPRILCSHPCTTAPELQPLEWCLYQGLLYFHAEPFRHPEDYPLTIATRQVGVTLFHVENVAIHDLTIQGFQLDAVNAHNSARNIVLQRVTCRGNGRAGVAVGGASLVSIESSLVGDNGAAQLLTDPYSETYVRQSNLLSNTAPAWLDRGGTVILDGEEVKGGLDQVQTAEERTSDES